MNKKNYFIIIIFCFIIINNNLPANEYYVNNRHPQASNANSGLKTSPWLTIQHAADVLKSGDICYVEGIYNERIFPQNSGQRGNLITYKAVGNTITRGFSIVDRSYIRVIGFEITHQNSSAQYQGFYLRGAHGCEIIDNYIHHTYDLGIWLHHSGVSNNVLIKGNRIAYTAVTEGRAMGTIAVYIYGNNNICEYNDISHVGDFINLWGEKNIVRNNYFHDCLLTDFPDNSMSEGHHTDGLQFYSKSGIRLYRVLVENNLFSNIVVPHAHTFILQDDNQTGSSEFLFRNNVDVRNGAYAVMATEFDNIRIINNTFVDILCSMTPKATYCLTFSRGAIGGKILNNIFYNSARAGGMLYSVDNSATNGFHADHNLAYLSGSPKEIHQIIDQNPQFKNYNNDNFYLQRNSPAIGAAGPLTTTVNSGTGANIRVQDAGYFTDGWGITEGDFIIVGTNNPVQITAINYETNNITLNSNITWNSGNNVNLAYRGTAPEMGAYEYRDDENYEFSIAITKPAANSYVSGTVTIEANVVNNECVRHVVFYVNGISQVTVNQSPFRYIWNTDALASGNYTIEARAYALYASSNLIQSDLKNVIVRKMESPAKLRFIK